MSKTISSKFGQIIVRTNLQQLDTDLLWTGLARTKDRGIEKVFLEVCGTW